MSPFKTLVKPSEHSFRILTSFVTLMQYTLIRKEVIPSEQTCKLGRCDSYIQNMKKKDYPGSHSGKSKHLILNGRIGSLFVREALLNKWFKKLTLTPPGGGGPPPPPYSGNARK